MPYTRMLGFIQKEPPNGYNQVSIIGKTLKNVWHFHTVEYFSGANYLTVWVNLRHYASARHKRTYIVCLTPEQAKLMGDSRSENIFTGV